MLILVLAESVGDDRADEPSIRNKSDESIHAVRNPILT
jgi:hypothetical protein